MLQQWWRYKKKPQQLMLSFFSSASKPTNQFYLQLSGVAQLVAGISWLVSMMCRLANRGATLYRTQNEANLQSWLNLCSLIWPLGVRLRCLRDAVWPPGRRLAVPPSSRSGGTGRLDLAKDKGAEVWLRRLRPRPSLSVIRDLAFLLMVPGVGKRPPRSWKEPWAYRGRTSAGDGVVTWSRTWSRLVGARGQHRHRLVVYSRSWTTGWRF